MSETDDLTMTTDADTLAFEEFIRRSNRAFVNGARHDEIYRQAFYAALADERNRTETTAENHAGLVAAITALADDAETPGFWHEDVAWVTVHSLRALLTADHTAALDKMLADDRARIAAALKRNHDMPPNKDRRNYGYRMGWWDAIHHAADFARNPKEAS